MPRHALPVLVAVLTAGLLADLRAQNDNVLVVIADDLGVDNVGVYAEGITPPPTPNIDALAARGVLFRNAWSNTNCSPTRACLHTGRYGTRTGVGYVIYYTPGKISAPQNVLPLAEVTLPELLDAEQSGYAHALIGKWHLGDETNGGAMAPNLAGWSHFAGFLKGGVNYVRWGRTVNGVTQTSRVYSTTQMVDDTLNWIRTAPEPWVAYLAFNAPHKPFHHPPPRLHTQPLSKSSGRVELYKAAVEAMDTEMGRLLTSLGPVLARTNVIFMGDNGTHGEVSQPPFEPSHAKGTAYEGGINVPLIVAGPAVTAPGREEAALVSAVDIFATVADLCGVSVPTTLSIDGVSFAPHLRDPQQTPVRTTVFSEWFSGPTPFRVRGGAMMRDAKHKLIWRFSRGPTVEEFYDLSADPFETNNLLLGALTTEQQTSRNALDAEMNAIRGNVGLFSNYGMRCQGSNGEPILSCAGLPSVGSSYAIHVRRAAPSQPAALLLGTSATSGPGGVSLPLALEPFGGGQGCFVYAGNELVFLTLTGALGQASVTIPVPDLPALISSDVYHSWLILDPAAPHPAGITPSDGGFVRIGA